MFSYFANTHDLYHQYLCFSSGAPVVIGICLPGGIDVSQVKLWARRPPNVITPNDGWIVVDTLDEVFADDTMTRVFVDGR